MVIGVLPTQFHPNRLEQVVRIYHEFTVPALRRAKGFRNVRLLTDHKTGRCLSIAEWDSEADALAWETSGAYQQQIALLGGFLMERPTRTIYEIGCES